MGAGAQAARRAGPRAAAADRPGPRHGGRRGARRRRLTALPRPANQAAFGRPFLWPRKDPSWHELMSLAWKHEVPNLAWRTNQKNGHFARAVLSYLWNQVEQGTACPTGMAYASYAGFEAEPALAIWAEKAKGTEYEFSRKEVGDKPSVVIGYAMTEKQGGSDLRETQTTARYSHSADYHGTTAHWYELTGHKWFCSVPQSDGFFTLAKVDGEVTCFFLPRTLPDGSYNRFFVQRLKDKAGNKSNASSEVEYAGTLAIRVGEEGRGIREILSHAHLTRLDFAIGSAGLMRQSLTLALRHTTTRNAFGTTIADRPMMTNVLADLAVEVEAATLMALRVAKATDQLASVEQERLLARVATPTAKFFNCSRAPSVAYEALQCHGGNGFIEENPMARLYREAPLNSVWEGTANMMCMDVRRAMLKDPRTIDALFDEVRPLAGQDARFDAMVQHAERLVREAGADEFLARPMTEAVARVLQGAELLRHSTQEVADVFLSTRNPGVAGAWGCHYGTLAVTVTQPVAKTIVQRAMVTEGC
ncbi:acyl-CoA dehydrogenase family protein [Azospirillum canadense]|uniref:acyl-CoA dehydrogenase family protein n=1 Tax=Azospirillum canadense TaxID=403962 RepID=UPI002226C31C|nr:acyl-CoA dehydrogenase family protein [Azospirillum canadense]